MPAPHNQSKLGLILMEDLTKRKYEGDSVSLRRDWEMQRAWQQWF